MEEGNDADSGSLVGDLTGLGKVVNSEIAKRSYADALSPAMREVGKLSEDFVKTFRLFTAPIQYLAAYQDRFSSFCERVRKKVPEDRQREAPPEIARPVMEAFASTSDDSPLMEMFEELMAKAIDVEESDKLSPSFPSIIQSLSPLQAKLIQSLHGGDHVTEVLRDNERSLIVKELKTNFSHEEYGGLGHHLTLVQDLRTKSLVANLVSLIDKSEYPDLTVPDDVELQRITYRLTMFGRWFASSCIQRPATATDPE